MTFKLFTKKIRRATGSDLGKKVAVLWNPQGVRDFKEKPSWKEGVIDEILDCGGFWIQFYGANGGIMLCSGINRNRRKVNPFKYVKEL